MRVLDRNRGRLPHYYRYGPRSRAVHCRVILRVPLYPILHDCTRRP